MRKDRSIRFRLTVWYTSVLTAALLLFGVSVWVLLRARLLANVDDELRDRIAGVTAFVTSEMQENPNTPLTEALTEFAQTLPGSLSLEVRDARGATVFGERGNAERTRAAQVTIRNAQYTIIAGASLEDATTTLRELAFLMLLLTPLMIAIASAGGVWLSRRALRPVDEITAAAKVIGIEQLSQRLPVPQTGDELQRLTEVWNAMLERLQSAVMVLSQFAADASHEMRTPLAVIRTTAEIALRRARHPEEYREALHGIARESVKMTQLVEDLLLLARHEGGSGEMATAHVYLHELLEAAYREIAPIASEHGIVVQIYGPDECFVRGNAPALQRLFVALLDNAIKYSHRGEEVRAQVSAGEVSIEDHGRGIEKQELPQIFRRFFRADAARTGSGHGLGLAIAASIAKAHGAVIDVESAPGAGSCFRVRFPGP